MRCEGEEQTGRQGLKPGHRTLDSERGECQRSGRPTRLPLHDKFCSPSSLDKVNTGEPYLFCIFKFSFLTRIHFICSIISVATYHTEAYYCSAGGRQRLGWYGIPEEHATTFLRLESGSISESHEKVSTKTEHACGIKTRESFFWRVESSSTDEREECM